MSTATCTLLRVTSTSLLSLTSIFLPLFLFFFYNHTSTTEIYTLSLHDALPISAPIGLEGNAGVARFRQPVGHILARIHVEELRSDFVLAALADAVNQQRAVFRDGSEIDTGCVVRAHGMRIDQHRVAAVQALAQIEHELVLAGQALAEKVAAIALGREFDGVDLQQRGESPLQVFAPGQPSQQRISVGVLCVDPRARFRRLLVFEPTVRVYQLDAMQYFCDVIHARLWRSLWLDTLAPGRRDHENGCENRSRQLPAKHPAESANGRMRMAGSSKHPCASSR